METCLLVCSAELADCIWKALRKLKRNLNQVSLFVIKANLTTSLAMVAKYLLLLREGLSPAAEVGLPEWLTDGRELTRHQYCTY